MATTTTTTTTGAKTAIAINMNINNVPAGNGINCEKEFSDKRHVVLNLDAVVINPKKSNNGSVNVYEKIEMPDSERLEVLKKCHRLFVTKQGEPWLQTYGIKTPANQWILRGKSDEVYRYSMERTEECVHLLSCNKDREIMRIEFQPIDYALGTHERSFNIKTVGYSFAEPDRKLGTVKLQDINGNYFLHGIFNEIDGTGFSSRSKRDSITVLQDGQPVAIIDLQRTKVLMWIESYMLTFTKDLSFNSKALILSSVICYDIAFYRRSESIKTIFVYFIYLIILFLAAAMIFVCLVKR